jgi:hypothetical protein
MIVVALIKNLCGLWEPVWSHIDQTVCWNQFVRRESADCRPCSACGRTVLSADEDEFAFVLTTDRCFWLALVKVWTLKTFKRNYIALGYGEFKCWSYFFIRCDKFKRRVFVGYPVSLQSKHKNMKGNENAREQMICVFVTSVRSERTQGILCSSVSLIFVKFGICGGRSIQTLFEELIFFASAQS